MNRAAILIWVIVISCVAGCGAKRTEMAETAKLSGHYTAERRYQEVFKGIADRFVECEASLTQNVQRNLYTDIGEGEFYLADNSGYVFLVEVKKTGENSTAIAAYSTISIGIYPKLMDMVKRVAENKKGCP